MNKQRINRFNQSGVSKPFFLNNLSKKPITSFDNIKPYYIIEWQVWLKSSWLVRGFPLLQRSED